MAFERLLGATEVSASGLSAERYRMEVLASNIANAFTTRTPDGGPYRRQDVVFESLLRDRVGRRGAGAPPGVGVAVAGTVDDPTAFPRVYNPGHPDADANGLVLMPNVSLPMEMVNLMTASRAYEANLKTLQALRQQMEQVLTLLRS
jgi:flagellar basal-body rod protein FlgC